MPVLGTDNWGVWSNGQLFLCCKLAAFPSLPVSQPVSQLQAGVSQCMVLRRAASKC